MLSAVCCHGQAQHTTLVRAYPPSVSSTLNCSCNTAFLAALMRVLQTAIPLLLYPTRPSASTMQLKAAASLAQRMPGKSATAASPTTACLEGERVCWHMTHACVRCCALFCWCQAMRASRGMCSLPCPAVYKPAALPNTAGLSMQAQRQRMLPQHSVRHSVEYAHAVEVR
jgi:hypothetical protein